MKTKVQLQAAARSAYAEKRLLAQQGTQIALCYHSNGYVCAIGAGYTTFEADKLDVMAGGSEIYKITDLNAYLPSSLQIDPRDLEWAGKLQTKHDYWYANQKPEAEAEFLKVLNS